MFAFRQIKAWTSRKKESRYDSKARAEPHTNSSQTNTSATNHTSQPPTLTAPAAPYAQGEGETRAYLAGDPSALTSLYKTQSLAAAKAHKTRSRARPSYRNFIRANGHDATMALATAPSDPAALAQLLQAQEHAEKTSKRNVPKLAQFPRNAGGFVPLKDLVGRELDLDSPSAWSSRVSFAGSAICDDVEIGGIPAPDRLALNLQGGGGAPKSAGASPTSPTSPIGLGLCLPVSPSASEHSEGKLSQEDYWYVLTSPWSPSPPSSDSDSSPGSDDGDDGDDGDDDDGDGGKENSHEYLESPQAGGPLDIISPHPRPLTLKSFRICKRVRGGNFPRRISITQGESYYDEDQKDAEGKSTHNENLTPSNDEDTGNQIIIARILPLPNRTPHRGLTRTTQKISPKPSRPYRSPPRFRQPYDSDGNPIFPRPPLLSSDFFSTSNRSPPKHPYNSPAGRRQLERIGQYFSLAADTPPCEILLFLLQLNAETRHEAAAVNAELELCASLVDWAGVDADVARMPHPDPLARDARVLMVRTFLQKPVPIFTWDMTAPLPAPPSPSRFADPEAEKRDRTRRRIWQAERRLSRGLSVEDKLAKTRLHMRRRESGLDCRGRVANPMRFFFWQKPGKSPLSNVLGVDDLQSEVDDGKGQEAAEVVQK